MKQTILFLLLSATLFAQKPFAGKNATFLGDSQVANWDLTAFLDSCDLAVIENKGLFASSISNASEKAANIPSFTNRVPSMGTNVDLVLVWGGTNDWYYAQFDTLSQAQNLDSFKVGMQQLCDALIAKYPLKKILFVTPTQRNYQGNPSGQNGLIDYVNVMISVCGDYSIQCVDAYRLASIRTQNLSQLTSDGLHLNTLGYEVFTRFLANEVNKTCIVSSQVSYDLAAVCDGDVSGWSVDADGNISVSSSVGSRAGLFFKAQFDSIEFTKTSLSYWSVLGGATNSYVAICNDYAYQLLCNMQPPSFTSVTNLPTPSTNFSGWTRIKITLIDSTYRFYAKNPSTQNFELIYSFSAADFSGLQSVWTSNLLGFSRDTQGVAGVIATDVKLNNIPIIQYLD